MLSHILHPHSSSSVSVDDCTQVFSWCCFVCLRIWIVLPSSVPVLPQAQQQQEAKMTMKLLSPMRAHSDITCLHSAIPEIRWAFIPQTFELPFSHQVALFVSVSASHFLIFLFLFYFLPQQEHICNTGFIASSSFAGLRLQTNDPHLSVCNVSLCGHRWFGFWT